MKESHNGVRLLMLWEMLSTETDEKNPLGTVAILQRLASKGMKCDRRTLYDDVKMLNAYGFEVLQERSRSNRYYVVNRSFDEPELHILLDAVQAAGFITDKKTVDLTDRISRLAGSRQAEVLKKNIVKFNTAKSANESIYYSVDTILTAIQQKKKVSFLYFDYDNRRLKVYRKEGKKYVVSPVFTAFSEENYYLVGFNDKYGNASPYRIDRMEKVEIVEESIDEKTREKIARLADKKIWFNMYTGESKKVTFSVRDDNRTLGVVYDKFGKDLVLTRGADGYVTFSAEVQLCPPFFAWLCELAPDLKVTAPADVVDWVRRGLTERLRAYEE
ncbi:MAG: WYL domain-containing protein [Clostridia bacterium]|nr:WYL domain-containing protein [Clostridia bacterium]